MKNFRKYIIGVIVLFGSISPIVSLAATTTTAVGCTFVSSGATLSTLIKYVICLISSSVIPLIFTLALAMFIWGVVQYVINSSEEKKKAEGRMFMIWGIIALAVMVSVWGLVHIVTNTFGINGGIPLTATK